MRKLLLLLMLSWTFASSFPAAGQFMQLRFLPPQGERGTLGPDQDFPAVRIGKNDLLIVRDWGVVSSCISLWRETPAQNLLGELAEIW